MIQLQEQGGWSNKYMIQGEGTMDKLKNTFQYFICSLHTCQGQSKLNSPLNRAQQELEYSLSKGSCQHMTSSKAEDFSFPVYSLSAAWTTGTWCFSCCAGNCVADPIEWAETDLQKVPASKSYLLGKELYYRVQWFLQTARSGCALDSERNLGYW